jgi:hypothetical protein
VRRRHAWRQDHTLEEQALAANGPSPSTAGTAGWSTFVTGRLGRAGLTTGELHLVKAGHALSDDAAVLCLDWYGEHGRERITSSGADLGRAGGLRP